MNKHTVIAVALLGVTGYSFAEEPKESESKVKVIMTSEIRVDQDMADDVVAEAKKDASALKEKYEPVCGINAVETCVKRSASEEEITKSCSSSCRCSCSSCSSGRCCSCRSVKLDDACSCQDGEGTRAVCEACEKIKEGNERKRQRQRELQQQQQTKSVRSLNDDEFCNCEIIHEKCPDCGKVTEEFRCNCGRPRPSADVEVDRCPCRPTSE